MGRRPLELADIVRSYGAALVASRGGRVSGAEARVLAAVSRCRTAALGGHVEECGHCGHRVVAYNSCRNRHCPRCQAAARREWLAEREAELLPVEYFHVVFTIPHELAPLALQNKRLVYDLLFQSAAEALLRIAADPRHLGAVIGVLAVLHTWGQTLDHHPHVHCVVPGGGLAPGGSRWVACRPGFFLPVAVLRRLFRGVFLAGLASLHAAGRLRLPGRVAERAEAESLSVWLAPLYRKEWVVYAKPPFGGPAAVLKYLARYTHRVAIANSRLVGMADGEVSFRWKDYAHGCRRRVMTLSAVEFLRRYLLHILPHGFQRIRHYGLLANRTRLANLARCRELLGTHADRAPVPASASPAAAPCPSCGRGTMRCVLSWQAGEAVPKVVILDSS